MVVLKLPPVLVFANITIVFPTVKIKLVEMMVVGVRVELLVQVQTFVRMVTVALLTVKIKHAGIMVVEVRVVIVLRELVTTEPVVLPIAEVKIVEVMGVEVLVAHVQGTIYVIPKDNVPVKR